MKKRIGMVLGLIFIMLLFIGGSFFYMNYQTSSSNAGRYESEIETLKQELSLLEKQVDENESYITGQTEYITELTQQISNLQSMTTDTEDSENSNTDSVSYNDVDLYPDLYAEKEYEGLTSLDEKNIYLTFDDGPSSLTPKVLDLLDEYNAKATFFVVYKEEEEYTGYLSEIVNRGHTLALHSYSHNYQKIYASVDAFLSDFQKVYDWVYEETGQRPTLFRFPGGSTNGKKAITDEIIKEMERRGFIYYDWNVSSGDGSNLTETENIVDNIISNVGSYENPVVLMHDGAGKNATMRALPTVLQKLKDKEYTFLALDDIMDPVQYKR